MRKAANPAGRSRGALSALVLAGLAVALLAGAVVIYYYACPCERTPGGYLFGTEVAEPVTDWSFANDVPLCQIEVRGWLPHSVNLNCMASEGELFLSCAECDGKRWSSLALDNPEGRIRLGEDVYPVQLTRVEDPETLDRAWRARARKVGADEEAERPVHWWSFRVESR